MEDSDQEHGVDDSEKAIVFQLLRTVENFIYKKII